MSNEFSGVLGGLVVGWYDIEPILVGCVAAKLNVILRGKHGTSKTVFAKLSAEALGGRHGHYDATKDDMVSVAGIPNPESLKQGVLEYSGHGRAIWDKLFVVIDEISRAAKETQNMWLEMINEKTCFGFPLICRMFMATMNPSTYNATYRMDEALLDRFAAIIDIPDVFKVDRRENIKKIIKMNKCGENGARPENSIKNLSVAITATEENYALFSKNEVIGEAIEDYIATYVDHIIASFKDNNFYVSPRRVLLLEKCINACAAYYKYAESAGLPKVEDGVFVAGAKIASQYVIGTSLNLKPSLTDAAHDVAKKHLGNLIGADSDKIRYEIQNEKSQKNKVSSLKKNLDSIGLWTSGEVGSLVYSISSEIISDIVTNIKKVEKNADPASNKQAVEDMVAAADAFDDMKSLFSEMTTNHSMVLRVCATECLSHLTANTANIMVSAASCQMSIKSKNRVRVCTYSKVKNFQRADSNLDGVWDGKLVNNSVKETLANIFVS